MERRAHGGGKPEVRLFLLGGFRAEREEGPVPDAAWGRPQARTLIKLLALDPSHRLHREQLLDRFWPNAETQAAGTSLRRLLYLARRVLSPDALLSRDDVIALAPERVWIDSDAFEQAARRGLSGGRIEELEAAAMLYGGELLPEDRYEEWAERRREELAALQLEVLLAAAAALEVEGRHDEAVRFLRGVLAMDPAQEVAHRSLMRLYARRGDRQQALRQYRHCVEALAEHVGAEPSRETEALYRQIVEGRLVRHRRLLPAALRQRSVTPLVGRDRALQLVRTGGMAYRQGARGDHRSVVLVGGEAGVGKTRLAAEAARAAEARGAVVLWGSASALEGRVMYGPFAEALEEYIASLSQTEKGALAADQPELGRIIPSLDVRGPIGGDPQSEQMRLFAGVTRLLTQIAGNGTLLLVLDDLHQADDASLQLLRYLARLAGDRRWSIIGTYREEGLQVETGLKTLIADLQRLGVSLHVDLLPLGRRECDGLVEAMLGPDVVEGGVLEHIFAQSLGNPFFAIELLESLRESGRLVLRDSRWRLEESAPTAAELPRGVTDLIESRIQSLGDDLRAVLAVASAAGMTCDPELLTVVTGQAEETVVPLLDRAVEARILEEREGGYAFRHPLFREVLYGGLSTWRNMRLHEALGQALEKKHPLDLDALAYHFSRSSDTEKAIVYLEQAARQTRDAYANEMAELLYRELLDRLQALDRPGDVARVQAELGSVLLVMTHFADGLSMLESASTLYRRLGDIESVGRVEARIGDAHANQGTIEEGLRRMEAAISELETRVSGPTLAILQLSRAQLLFWSGQYECQLDAGRRAAAAVDPAEGMESTLLRTQALMLQGMALAVLGRTASAGDTLRAALAACPPDGDLELLGLIHLHLSWVCMLRGELADALASARSSLDFLQSLGAPGWIAAARARLGLAYLLVGDVAGAQQLLDQTVADLRHIESPVYAAHLLSYRGLCALTTGDLPEAKRLLQEGLVTARQVGDPNAAQFAACFLAEAHITEGRAERALACLEPLTATVAGIGGASYESIRALGAAAWAHAELGNVEMAERLSVTALDRVRDTDMLIIKIELLTHRGIVLAAQQHREEAEAHLQQALDLGRQIGYVFREAWVLSWWAQIEARRGRTERARELAEEGAAIYRRYGAGDAADALLALTEAAESAKR